MPIYESYMYRKEVDWSLLHEGLTIPVRLQVAFKSLLTGYDLGMGKTITLLMDGQAYDAKLINQKFDRNKYIGHTDVVQIRFTEKSGLPLKLRQIFPTSYTWLKGEREKVAGKKHRLPESAREYLALYTTALPDVFEVEAITRYDLSEATSALAGISEEEFEYVENYARRDDSASIVMRPQLAKVRKLDRSIGENLKTLYDFRCQICAADFGTPYDRHVAEVHHIIQFVQSMNNDFDNLMVLYPNHHTVIHKSPPTFDRQKLMLTYPNGYLEKLKLDRHFNLTTPSPVNIQ